MNRAPLLFISMVFAADCLAANDVTNNRSTFQDLTNAAARSQNSGSIQEKSAELWWSAFGAAVGGLIGGLLVFGLRYRMEIRRSEPRLLQKYLCAHPMNTGVAEHEGQLKHHFGRAVSDSAQLRQFEVDHPIWEWTRDRLEPDGTAIIYGPYSTDFHEPGVHSATFRVRGVAFSTEIDEKHNFPILRLDVTRHIEKNNAEKSWKEWQHLCRKDIFAKDLATGQWQEFKLLFYSDCQGLWEYRIFAFQGIPLPDYLKEFGTNIKLLFDTIEIKKENKVSLPWP